MNNRSVLAFLGGAAVGALVALLLAPKTGEETRGMVKGYLYKGKNMICGCDCSEEGCGCGPDCDCGPDCECNNTDSPKA